MTKTNGPEQERIEKFCETTICCDLCNKCTNPTTSARDEINWAEATYDVAVSTVSFQDGVGYPDGSGHGQRAAADICPECFKSKLIPWLNSQGANVQVEDYSH